MAYLSPGNAAIDMLSLYSPKLIAFSVHPWKNSGTDGTKGVDRKA